MRQDMTLYASSGGGMPRRRCQDLDVVRLTEILEDDQACRDLRLYFGVGLGRRKLPPFTGGRFELLDGGGDRPDTCNRFTASDILAIGMLSVQLPPLVTLDLLEGALGEEATGFLNLGYSVHDRRVSRSCV
jgi:Family of unknown function (DUF6308)